MSYRDNWQGTDFRLHCGISYNPAVGAVQSHSAAADLQSKPQ